MMTREDRSPNGAELQALKRQLNWEERILQSSFDAIVAANLDGIITYANQATADLLGLPDTETVVGTSVKTWVQLPESGSTMRQQLLAANGLFRQKFWLNTKTGREALVEMNVSLLHDDDGQPISIAGVARDITEQEKERALIEEMLREKELLVKEMNHRIKNNILLMETLLESKSSPDRQNIALDEVFQQTRTMRTIHDLLYGNDGLDEIEVHTYLQRLVYEINTALPAGTMTWESDLDDLTLDSRSAVTVGLIVNELATNALKYGQTYGENLGMPGRIVIRLTVDSARGECILMFHNDGAPFPENIDINSPEVSGLGLVRVLVDQLNGTLELERTPSPTFTIRWPFENRSSGPS